MMGGAVSAQLHPGGGAIRGYLNPKTGYFVATEGNRWHEEATSLVTRSGTFTVNMAISIRTGFSETTSLRCGVIATPVGTTYNGSPLFVDTKVVNAVRTGNTATCKVSLFYSWLVPPQNSTAMSVALNYYVESLAETGTSVARNHTASLPLFAMPADGFNTIKSVEVTL
jgi:hypothetical protein